MKRLGKFTYRRTSEKGSVIVQVIVFAAILAVIGGITLSHFSQQNNIQAGKRIVDELESLHSLLAMTFSNQVACNANLTGALFGTNRNTLGRRQAQVQFPAPSNIRLRANSNFNTLQITSITFSDPVQIHSPDPSYLSDLTIEVRDMGNNLATRKILIPFYFVESGGTFRECFATSYPTPQPPPPEKITMEDAICRNWQKRIGVGGTDFIYAPFYKTCVRGI